jgi:putative ABC transport system ATP-binding protein
VSQSRTHDAHVPARQRGCDIRLVDVVRLYEQPGGEPPIVALAALNLHVRRGEAVAVVGASGSGKSTLLNLVGALDRPTTGTVEIDGADIARLSPSARARHRRRVGMVFQQYRLLPSLSALENVAAPLVPDTPAKRARQTALDCLDEVGLAARATARPSELSGGQQQRVAIARALAVGPSLLLADEPTGNLDTFTGRAVLDVLFRVRERRAMTLVLVTHDPALAESCDRVVRIEGGRIVSDLIRRDPGAGAGRLSRAGTAADRRTPSARG